MNYRNPDENGYYGEFGGAFIPEMLYPNVEELQKNYLEIIESEEFQNEYQDLLKNYVGRATPLYFAKNLSQKYNTRIYLKREDLNHTGAHKINNALGQVLLAKRLGKTRIIAETGAGQHGVATATACALLGLECIVYMGEIDIQRQAPNVARMKMLGAEVIPATSGSKTLKDAVNEALRDWINNPVTTHYVIGSVVGPSFSRPGGQIPEYYFKRNQGTAERKNRKRKSGLCNCVCRRRKQCRRNFLPFCRRKRGEDHCRRSRRSWRRFRKICRHYFPGNTWCSSRKQKSCHAD